MSVDNSLRAEIDRPRIEERMMPTTDAAARARATTGRCDASLLVSLELSRSCWLVTSLAPGSDKMSKHSVAGGDGNGLLGLMQRLRSRAEKRVGAPVELVTIQEADLDGF
jgi:transposase